MHTRAESRIEHHTTTESRVERHAISLARSLASSGAVDWSNIASIISNRVGDAGCTDVHALVRWTQQWGGLPHGRFIADLNGFHTTYVPSGRRIPSSTFGALADLKLGPDELAPFFVCGVLKAQASCPQAKVCSKVCRFVSASDINALQSGRKGLMLQAEAILKKARELIAAADVDSHAATKFCGRLDTMIVRYVLGKPMVEKFDSMEAIARSFFAELKTDVENPWPEPASGSGASQQASTVAPNLVEFDATGQVVAAKRLALLKQGFVESTVVQNDKSGKQSTIEQALTRACSQ